MVFTFLHDDAEPYQIGRKMRNVPIQMALGQVAKFFGQPETVGFRNIPICNL